ncbi:type 2 periplasmic-binding domain-containing protein [Algicola sagamiensis]|uniref:hypothetical protein n=1 Tax=Algicola sagamiensis TaxID=163869 RepID=UPI00036DB96D|nr:hypothetical protein [Algicola sagamiensis]
MNARLCLTKLLMVYCFVFIMGIATFVRADVVIIVHPTAEQLLTDIQIARIFLGKDKFLPNGEQITPVSMKKTTSAYKEFSQDVMKKKPKQFSAHWSRIAFTGKAAPLQEATTSEELKRMVAENPNMIGFIPKEDVDDSVKAIDISQSF